MNRIKSRKMSCLLALVMMFSLVSCKNDKGNSTTASSEIISSSTSTTDTSKLTFKLLANNTYSVGAKDINEENITIPEAYQGLRVTEVSEQGFSNVDKIKFINLPSTIQKIGNKAFQGCTSLNSISVGSVPIDPVIVSTPLNNEVKGFSSSIEIGNNAFDDTGFLQISFKDSDNFADVDVQIKNFKNKLSTLGYNLKLNELTDIESSGEITLPTNGTDLYKTKINAKTFGLFKNSSITINPNTSNIKYDLNGLSVTADEYTFAPLNGSYPVLVYSLKLKEITNEGKIPSFVFLERADSYDWNKLAYNLSYLPNISREEATRSFTFHPLRKPMAEYIKELYSLNKKSKFHLYAVDNYPELILEMLVANQIPEQQWTATLLSDGRETAGSMEATFGTSSPKPYEKMLKMIENWIEVKNYVFNAGEFDRNVVINKMIYKSSSYSFSAPYSYPIFRSQSNVRYWVNRLRPAENLVKINNIDSEFANEIKNTTTAFYTNNLLTSLTEEEQIQFKNLYKFDDDMFTSSKEQGKKIMVILGANYNSEDNNQLLNYTRMIMLHYGDEFDYYYKGHPGYPTSSYPGRNTQLETLRSEGHKITELDNSIAAEIILFYNPTVYSCGWKTTTFESIENEEYITTIFNFSYSSKNTVVYGNLLDMFFTPLATNSPLRNSLSLDATHTYYLIEFNDSTDLQRENYNKHEFGIFDATDKMLSYYKQNVDSYTQVDKEGNTINN